MLLVLLFISHSSSMPNYVFPQLLSDPRWFLQIDIELFCCAVAMPSYGHRSGASILSSLSLFFYSLSGHFLCFLASSSCGSFFISLNSCLPLPRSALGSSLNLNRTHRIYR
uniref:Uncharacterized protein n=1 Tax=Fundulus heteroclitus TaxID=8078 RepID=A0A146PYJ4_FUNHE